MSIKERIYNYCTILILCLNIFSNTVAQTITGQVLEPGGKPLAFATIKFGDTKQGIIANLEGRFSFDSKVKIIEVSHTNYATQKVEILQGIKELVITLQLSPVNLEPIVIVRTSDKKLRRILNNATANRSMHNPDKYDWYQCNVYYKMLVEFNTPDSSEAKDTGNEWP